MSGVIDSIERAQLRRVPLFHSGDRVRVHFQVVEGTRRRTQVFEGVVIKRQGSGARETFTVRKQSFGVGVERTFPLHSPKIERIEVAGRGDVRRAKLYYLRDRVGRGARVRERRFTGQEEQVYVEGTMPPPEADVPEAIEAEAADELDPRDEGVEEVIEAEAEAQEGTDAEAADAEGADAEAPVDAEAPGDDANESPDSPEAAAPDETAGEDDPAAADAEPDDAATAEAAAPDEGEGSADESRA